VSKSTFKGFAPKDAAQKTEFFCIRYFSKNKAQINKTNYTMTLFMSKQVSLPKISSILQKIKSAQNAIYALFSQKPSTACH